MNPNADLYSDCKNVKMEAETKTFFRYPAVKITLREIEESKYIEEENQNPNYLLTLSQKKIVRVNVLATMVHKELRGTATNILIDDGTGKIMLHIFEENKTILDLEVGDTLLVIGRVRRYNQEKYLFPEIFFE